MAGALLVRLWAAEQPACLEWRLTNRLFFTASPAPAREPEMRVRICGHGEVNMGQRDILLTAIVHAHVRDMQLRGYLSHHVGASTHHGARANFLIVKECQQSDVSISSHVLSHVAGCQQALAREVRV